MKRFIILVHISFSLMGIASSTMYHYLMNGTHCQTTIAIKYLSMPVEH
jgi:hypothetical protein